MKTLFYGSQILLLLISMIAISIDIMDAKGLIDISNWTCPIKEGSLVHLVHEKTSIGKIYGDR